MNLAALTDRALTQVWRLAGSTVQTCTYVVPAGFNAATGLTRLTETRVMVQAMITALRPREWDLVLTQPGDERVLVRSKELGSVVPVAGDYLLALDGTRRDVQLTRKVAGGIVWMLYCTANLSEDWGDLTAVTATEDRGDFTASATTEDWGWIG
jgi:hypothetical protein